ncbi:DNA repair and recombination protein RAD54B [Capronia coronata CBS 617.96]|uniref:DNA repair and recombination protein RAD54B n=1 Tax=Capronia coronata CBS 617.96 TaxID=1182541 RepID=W9Y1Z9_9EURO|nr:DNA repair and recombination protein RAD54B [Capronia coronata CBS 617.96]EXJ83670.1 DNA repair and recombination protein RAD54B [Capronia coronata CBS 617.96]
MSSKPFKPLTLRKPLTSDDCGDVMHPPIKRRKLSPPDDSHTAATYRQTALTNKDVHSHNNSERAALRDIRNLSDPVEKQEKPNSDGFASYYSVLWRAPTNKKNKTWTDDGQLAVAGGYATLYNKSGKIIGRTAFSAPLLPGSALSIGGKEVEVDSCITKNDHVSIIKPAPAATKVVDSSISKPLFTAPLMSQPRKQSMKAQMRALIQNEKTESQKNGNPQPSRVAAFRQPLKESTILPQGPSETPIPRHDPKANGALVFKRPKNPPQGRQTVDVVLDPLIGRLLRPHQREGVKFLYECVMGLRSFDGQGCILADDMGLGKTLTTIALLWTLLRQSPVYRGAPVIKKALIVCPVSLIRNWKREFKKWLGLDRLGVLEFEDQTTRLSDFDGRVYQVMIIGYERLRIVADDLAKGQPIDIVICDEGHRLKTMKNKNAQAIESLNTRRRVILSGTPIQNDLGEFFAMVNFVNDGCLGSQKGFIRDFEKPIIRSRQPDASEEEIERGQEASEELARTTSPFILRRTADILSEFLPPKTEYVLFCKPTQGQAKIYRNILKSPMFHSALRSNESAFQLITILKKLCNSPALMDPKFGNDDSTPSSSLKTLNEMLPEGLSKLYHNSLSCKIRLLDELLQQIRHNTDEKVVVISNYTSTLNLIEQLLVNSNLPHLRLDGSIAAKKRQGLVDQFNQSKSTESFAFLLSAKAGGVGLNLIGASRLVLFDVDWNPATDDQAVARIHRQGQKRHCKIYRFLVKGGIEERIWQRQVVKRALADSIMQGKSAGSAGRLEGGGKGQTATFSQDELKDLFRLDESDGLRTHDLIQCPCDGTGPKDETVEDFMGDGQILVDDQQSNATVGDSEDEFPDIAEFAKEGVIKSETLTKTEREAECEELMRYMHLDMSVLSKTEKEGSVVNGVASAIGDACLEHVVRLEADMVGGGGVSYVFKRTEGSQLLEQTGKAPINSY